MSWQYRPQNEFPEVSISNNEYRDFVDLSHFNLLEQEQEIDKKFGETDLGDAIFYYRRALLCLFSDQIAQTIYVDSPLSHFSPLTEGIKNYRPSFEENHNIEGYEQDQIQTLDYAYQVALYSLLFKDFLDEDLSFEDYISNLPKGLNVLVFQHVNNLEGGRFSYVVGSYNLITCQTEMKSTQTPYGSIDTPIRVWISRPAKLEEIDKYRKLKL